MLRTVRLQQFTFAIALKERWEEEATADRPRCSELQVPCSGGSWGGVGFPAQHPATAACAAPITDDQTKQQVYEY